MKNDLRELIKGADWDVQLFNAYPFFLNSSSPSGFKLPWGLAYKHFLLIAHSEKVAYYYDKNDYERIGQIFWDKIKRLADLTVLINDYNNTYQAVLKDASYDQVKLNSFTKEELKNLLKKQAELLFVSCGTAHIIECATQFAEKHLLAKYSIDPNLLKPFDLSFLKKAEIFANKLCSSNKIEEEILRDFKKEYSWIQNSYLGMNEIFIEDVKELAKKVSEEIIDEETKINSQIKDDFIVIMSHIFSWHDERKANLLKSVESSHLVLDALADKLEIPKQNIVFLLPEEIDKIDDKNFQEELAQRKKIFADYSTKDQPRILLVGEEAENFSKELSSQDELNNDIIKGAVAFPGKINGRVKVCLSLDSIKDFQVGEILVASMTRPEYISSMKKAIAIITDEGGITCHAAIISRELKIPCITGTKIATKILKDGDLVEVDADQGIIKKI